MHAVVGSAWVWRRNGLTRDRTAEPSSRDQVIMRVRGHGKIHFRCTADNRTGLATITVNVYSAVCYDHLYIHSSIPLQPRSILCPHGVPSAHIFDQTPSHRGFYASRCGNNVSSLICLALLLANSRRVFLLFPPRDHQPQPSLHHRLISHPFVGRHNFPSTLDTKTTGIALHAVNAFCLLAFLPSPYCTLEIHERVHFGNRPSLMQMNGPTHKDLLERTVVLMFSQSVILRAPGGDDPIVWCLMLFSDTKLRPVLRTVRSLGRVTGKEPTYCIQT